MEGQPSNLIINAEAIGELDASIRYMPLIHKLFNKHFLRTEITYQNSSTSSWCQKVNAVYWRTVVPHLLSSFQTACNNEAVQLATHRYRHIHTHIHVHVHTHTRVRTHTHTHTLKETLKEEHPKVTSFCQRQTTVSRKNQYSSFLHT